MRLNKILLASPHRHTPLIKFLGKRSLLQEHNNNSSDSHNQAQSAENTQKETKAQPSVGPFNTKLLYLEDTELPDKFKRVHPTEFEADIIELGGAY